MRRTAATKRLKSKAVADAGIFPIAEAPRPRRPYAFGDGSVGVEGRIYTPEGLFSQVLPATGAAGKVSGPTVEHVSLDSAEEPGKVDADREARDEKKRRQWQKWSEDIIPALLRPYLHLLKETSGLRLMESVRRKGCKGCDGVRQLTVSCIYFERIENINLCMCKEPALQLLECGLFPCAPSEPTLAVDLNVLDFARELFVNAAPNTTAWCDTLEGFLGSRKYKLKTRNSLRGRFGNALHWYANLTNTANLKIRDYLNAVRGSVLTMEDGDEEMDHEPQQLPEDTLMEDSTGEGQESGGSGNRPSEYLRERCPCCFGGDNWHKPDEMVDAIVCIDACFTQKRRKDQSDSWKPPHSHPETIFVSAEEVAEMEATVEELRPSKSKKQAPTGQSAEAEESDSSTGGTESHRKQKKNSSPANKDDNDYIPGMRVPNSVLKECNDSFTAADERRVKASTLFFADTGLMAILCRHDRVLWLVNMTSAGEKQYYALTLLQKLFQHVPPHFRAGVLYDVGCQLDLSCKKYGFLASFIDRIIFAISVFHAYGHNWLCQIIYHPRKCPGFGLSDGEGCERFWSLIKSLIPACRVSGYFTWLYTIDTQVKHLDEVSLLSLGSWLKRKWLTMVEKKTLAAKKLEAVYDQGFTEADLRKEWDSQIKEQMKPLQKQSKNIAKKEIEEILTLEKNVKDYKAQQEGLEAMIEKGDYEEGMDIHLAQSTIAELRAKVKNAQKAIATKRAKLSVDEQANLARLKKNNFLRLRLNALAIKHRIRERLRQRKFELEQLHNSYRSSVNQAKLDKHAQQQVKHKEPGIQTLARNYNKLCTDMEAIIKAKKAPKGALVPLKIDTEKLFSLDVDDPIWQDTGLTDQTDDLASIPDWLGNEWVVEGIKALLRHDRCLEEERRLIEEKISMQQWFQEEWEVASVATNWLGEDEDILYQVEERKHRLLQLYLAWEPAIQVIPSKTRQVFIWGPSQQEIDAAKAFEKTEQVVSWVEDETHEIGSSNEDSDDESENEMVTSACDGSVDDEEEIESNSTDYEEALEDAEYMDNIEYY
ncbi:hypothetical protein CVT26_008736, partial [Gymnopilus dilepis]